MFRISPSVAEEYRKLIHKPNARREWSIIPLSTVVWEDEHPGGRCTLPRMDEESRISIIQLVGARTALWLNGQVPSELQQLWEQAMAALPEWPGFRRLSLTDEDRAAVRLFQAELDAFEQEFLADADEVSRSIDEQGITRIEARFDLTKRGRR